MHQLTKKDILDKINDPEGLEHLYQSDPDQFQEIMLSLPANDPGATGISFWRARLLVRGMAHLKAAVPLLTVFFIALVNAIFIRVPAEILQDELYYLRFAPMFTLLSVAAYFLAKQFNRTMAIGAGVFAVVTVVYVFLLPDPESSDSVAMALVHLPFTTLSLVGLAFLQDKWRQGGSRIDFVKFCGEIFILTVLILLGGGVLSALTMALFELMGVSIEDWYMNNIGLIGIVSAPLVATYVYDSVLNRKIFITELLAKIFAPLFCLFVLIYLGVMLVSGYSPFENREYLIVFNGLLIVILAIVIFSLVSRQRKTVIMVIDYMNIAMVAATILIDLLALSAIIFRIFEYGITPNRFAVTGMNLVVLIHLVLIGITYVRVLSKKADFSGLKEKVVEYFPVYVGWFVFITYLFPLLFGFS